MPMWLTDDEYRMLSAACDRLIPPGDGTGRARRLPGCPTTSTGCSAPSRSTRLGSGPGDPTSGRHGGAEAFARVPPADRRSTSWPGGRGSRGPAACPSASSTDRSSASSSATATGWPPSGADFCELGPGRAGRPARGRPRLHRPAVRPRLRGHVRRARVRRATGTVPAGGPSTSRATSSPGAGPTPRCPTRDRRRRHHRIGPGRGHRGRRAHRGRLDGGHRREGPQPPARPRRPDPPGRSTTRTTRSSSSAATSSAPTRWSSPGPSGPARTTATAPTSARSTRSRPRSAGAAPTPTARCPVSCPATSASCSALGPQPDADVADWPIAYDELEPYYAEVERAIGVAGTEGANPFAGPRSGPFPMPSGRSDVRRRPVQRRRRAPRVPPLPGSDRGQQRPLRRQAGLQQLRLLRLLRLPDPRQGRPGRHAHSGPWPAGGPSWWPRPSCPGSAPRAAGPPGSTWSGPTAPSAPWPPGTWSWPPGPSRHHGCCCCPGSTTRCWAAT